MKLNPLLCNRVKQNLVVASSALAILSAGQGASLAPQWMQGGHAARISGVACSPDGTMIASASEDGTVKLWSTNGTLLKTLNTQPYPTTAIAWSPDGSRIAAGTYYGGVVSSKAGAGLTYLWQAPSGWTAADVSLVRVTTNRYGKVTALAFSADSSRLASGSAAGSNHVNSVANGSVLASRPAYDTAVGPAAVTSVAFSQAGLMASGCEDATIRVYNSSWSQVWISTGSADAHPTNVTAAAFSPDGSLLATASLDRNVKIWSTSNWTLQQTLTGHTNGVTSVAFSPDGQKVVSGSLDGTVKVWASSGECLVTIAAHALPLTATVFSTDGTRVVSASEDNTVRLWSAEDGSAVGTLGGQISDLGVVAVSPDGTLCASVGRDQTVQVRKASDGALVRTLPGNTNHVSSLAFSPDSATLASGGGPLDPAIKLWRISDGTLLSTIAATTNGVMALAWSPDGSTLASGGDCTEQVIRLWDLVSGDLLRTLAGHTNGVTALAFSPRGDLLASGGRRFDNQVKIWAVTNGSLVRALSGHANNIEAVAFAPDGNTVASGGSGNNPLKVWRVSDGSFRNFGTGTNPVFAVAFSPEGGTLASAEQDTIRLWDVASGALLETITQETFRVSSLAYSPNGNRLLHAREDGTLVLSANTRGARGQPPLAFRGLTVGQDHQTALEATVQPWTRYVIQTSTDLDNWTFRTSTFSQSNSLSIPGPETGAAPLRFYRALTPP